MIFYIGRHIADWNFVSIIYHYTLMPTPTVLQQDLREFFQVS